VDGEVLAPGVLRNTWEKETLAVTFIKFIVFFGFSLEDGCAWDSSNCVSVLPMHRENVTSRFEILIQLESLILAQNERWRQA
jgi:hypothetical protein